MVSLPSAVANLLPAVARPATWLATGSTTGRATTRPREPDPLERADAAQPAYDHSHCNLVLLLVRRRLRNRDLSRMSRRASAAISPGVSALFERSRARNDHASHPAIGTHDRYGHRARIPARDRGRVIPRATRHDDDDVLRFLDDSQGSLSIHLADTVATPRP